MNQKRCQSYLELIVVLLMNSKAARCEILKCNQSLVNTDLVQTTLQSASVLTALRRDWYFSNTLMELVRQLLGLYTDKPLQGMSSEFVIGNVCLDMREFSKAREFYEQALDIFRTVNDRSGEGNALALIGDTFYHQDAFYQAIEYYKQAQAIFLSTCAKLSEAMVLYQMRSSYYFMSQYAQAIELTERRLVIARELLLRSLEAHALHEQGNNYQAMNNISQAEKCYKQSWAIAKEIGAGELQVQNLRGLGDFYISQGWIKDAIWITKRVGTALVS
jgi:tetratricopeptide (TPR) repeat protein